MYGALVAALRVAGVAEGAEGEVLEGLEGALGVVAEGDDLREGAVQ